MNKSAFMTALEKTFEKDCNDLSDLVIPQFELSDEFQNKMTKLIKLQNKPFFILMSSAGRRIAFFIAVLFIMLTSSFWLKTLRKQFKTLCEKF